jgi:ABC-type uncharacterized transport system YnjBCD ATPase subunit
LNDKSITITVLPSGVLAVALVGPSGIGQVVIISLLSGGLAKSPFEMEDNLFLKIQVCLTCLMVMTMNDEQQVPKKQKQNRGVSYICISVICSM